MNKRWTIKEDLFLHAYFDAVGDYCGSHDLGRPVGAATRRVKTLKRCGAWEAMNRMTEAERDYRRCLGIPTIEDEE